MSEPEAHRRMQRQAMQSGTKMAEYAAALLREAESER